MPPHSPSDSRWVQLKDKFTQKWTSSHYLLPLSMLMESRVEVSSSTKHFQSFTVKQRCSIFQNNWSGWRLGKKQTISGSVQLVGCNPSLWKPRDLKLIWKGVIYMFLKVFTVAAKLKVSNSANSVYNLGSGGFQRLALHLTSCTEPFHIFLYSFLVVFWHFLKQVPIYFSCLGECCNAVLPWSSRNVLWTAKLHPTFHQHEGE